MSDKILIFSADGHVSAPPATYRDYVEAKYLDDLKQAEAESEAFTAASITQERYTGELLDIIDPDHAIREGGVTGAWDVDVRLRELDREGIAGELLLSGTQLVSLPWFHATSEPSTAELRQAGMKAFHRHLADFIGASGGRLFGVADPGTCLDMDDTVAELHWVADHGYIGVHPPGMIDDPSLPPLYDEYYEPFWAASAELGLVQNAHAGYGTVQGQFATAMIQQMREAMGNPNDAELLKMVMTADMGLDKMPYDAPPRVALTKPRRILWQMMLGGVFDRHPELKVVVTEIRADWVPDTIGYLDTAFDEGRFPSKRRPSEYWAENCAACPSSPRPYEIALRDQIGIDRLMFGADYPHPEGTWPNTRDWIRHAFAGVPEADVRKILGENSIAFYGLDREPLAAITEKIGIPPSDVLGDGHHVDDALVEQFHNRSGYQRPAELLDPGFMDSMISEDVIGAGV